MDNIDQLFRFIFEKLDIRGELINLDSSWKTVLKRYAYPENVQQQLGEAMAAVAILSSTIKFDGSLILQVQGDGPLSTLVAQASNDGKLCGLAKWKEDVPKSNLTDIYGKGRMVITVSNKKGEPYQSIVPLTGDSLSDALEYYFIHSEQLKSKFWLFVNQEKVTGLFLQEMPAQMNNKEQTEDAWNRVSMLADTLTAEELLNLKPEEILHRLYHEEQIRIYEPKSFRFECNCSRQKIENSLIAMGEVSLHEIIKDEGKIAVDCEFCNEHYDFNAEDVDLLFVDTATKTDLKEDQTIH